VTALLALIPEFVKLLTSGLGKIVMIGAGVVLVLWWVDSSARQQERAKCDTSKLESKIEALQRDITIARNAEIDASIRGIQIEARASGYQEEVRRIQDELDQARARAEEEPPSPEVVPAPVSAAEPAPVARSPNARRCVLTLDGLNRLQRIGPRPAGAEPGAAPGMVGKGGGATQGRR
jgi:hypothetical protein